MAESKHTPGPWVEFVDEGETVAIIPAGREGDICSFAAPYPKRDDARLMRAAPDLLGALQQIESGSFPGAGTAAIDGTFSAKLQAIARAAIVKATGIETFEQIEATILSGQMPAERVPGYPAEHPEFAAWYRARAEQRK